MNCHILCEPSATSLGNRYTDMNDLRESTSVDWILKHPDILLWVVKPVFNIAFNIWTKRHSDDIQKHVFQVWFAC